MTENQKLERLIQTEDKNYFLLREDIEIWAKNIQYIGKIKTLVAEHPCLDISNLIDKMTDDNSDFIPKMANAYVSSEFNPSTQHLKIIPGGKEKFYSIYAIQFYKINRNP